MNITKSQLNYLMAIDFLEGESVSQSKICNYLGVKRSSASIALKKLCESGYVEKADYDFGCEYKLTEKSRRILKLVEKEKLEFFSLFCKKLSIRYELCEKEYNKICGMIGEEFIDKLAEARENGYGIESETNEKIKANETDSYLENGVYELPFKVVHEGDGSPSMGNKGFIHPARLIIDGENDRVLLKAKEIYYKSKNS
ncbi:MAG: MarR family transcriptional regulator [Clostridiales bacterium]|nr:MarR family transcriptional regulator [Clostridiales bacterium]